MREVSADILLATGPDCDRVGVAVPDGDDYRILNGNKVGILLLDYICKSRKREGTMPTNPIAVKTIVTTGMAEKIASECSVAIINVLTGFKYIGETIGKLEESNEEKRFIFGFEESCGYLSGIYAWDKDAVNACLLICDMADYYKCLGITLAQQMDLLYEAHGYYICALDSFSFEGEQGFNIMQETMVYAGESIPEITMENHPDFILHYQKSVLSSIVERGLLTPSQMERVMVELERKDFDTKKKI